MHHMVKTVLVVEDNPLNMRLFHDLLQTQGHLVLQATNGMQGWELAQEHHPDLILMDIHLPDVLGLEVTKWLKNDVVLRTIPVIAVTAFAMKGDEELILDSGCDGYISKPISVPKFFEAVSNILYRSEQRLRNEPNSYDATRSTGSRAPDSRLKGLGPLHRPQTA